MRFNGKPLGSGGQAQSTVGVAPETIAQQFCHVASDMRALLKETRKSSSMLSNSIELQQEMSQQITKMTESVNKLSENMLVFMDLVKEIIEKNDELVEDLTENTLIVASAFRPKDEDMEDLQQRVKPRMEKMRNDRQRRRKNRRARRAVPPAE